MQRAEAGRWIGAPDGGKDEQVERLFESRPDARSRRNSDREISWFVQNFREGRIGLRYLHVPAVICRIVLRRNEFRLSRTESPEHQYLKASVRESMLLSGMKDAKEEVTHLGRRFDVGCPSKNIYFECGNSNIAKMRRLIADRTHPQFFLIPFQRAARDALEGQDVRSLLMIEVFWPEPFEADAVLRRPITYSPTLLGETI